MKLVKKSLVLALSVIVAGVMLAACGSSGGDAPAPAGSSSAGGSGNAASGGKLKMVTESTFPPYEFYDDAGNITGIDVEIAENIADALGMELEIEDIAFDSIITAVQTGKADIGIAGITVTEDRLENVSFSEPYTNAVQVVIIPEGSDIASVDDLTGKTIAVQTGTTGDIYAEDIEGAQIEQFTKATDGVLALTSGKVDAMIIDSAPANAFVAQNEGLTILEEDFENEDYAIAVAKDNTELLDKINDALKEMKSNGTLDEIIAKYINEGE